MDTMVEVVVVDVVATEEEEGAAVEEEVAEEDPGTIITALGTTHHKGQLLVEIKNSKRQLEDSMIFAYRIGLVLNPFK